MELEFLTGKRGTWTCIDHDTTPVLHTKRPTKRATKGTMLHVTEKYKGILVYMVCLMLSLSLVW